jgi:hypothetical protein
LKRCRNKTAIDPTYEAFHSGVEGRVIMLRKLLAHPGFLWTILFLLASSMVRWGALTDWRNDLVLGAWFLLVIRLAVVLLTS